MKVSIWQQFSSNHSSRFHIVGVFDTAEAAQKAADEIKQILKQIADWHNQNPEKAKALYEDWSYGFPQKLSEIEETLAKQYSVRWENGIEWSWDARIDFILDHIIHIRTASQTDTGPEPFDQIIERLGGHGFIAGSDAGGTPFGTIRIYLSCEVPDDETADKIAMTYTNQKNNIATLEIHKNYLSFSWDFSYRDWKLDRLIQELKSLGCKFIHYSFHGTRNVYTYSFKVIDNNESDKQ